MDLLPMSGNVHTNCNSCNALAIAVIVDPTRRAGRQSSFFVCEDHLLTLLREYPSHSSRLLSGLPDQKRHTFHSRLNQTPGLRAA
jgi:hypothetical protein